MVQGSRLGDAVTGGSGHVLGVASSILGQPWHWRALAADRRKDTGGDDLLTQLLLARGAPREALERHRRPSIRGFMPDPSVFRDMDRAAARLAAAVEAREQVAIFGDYDVDGATSAALLLLVLRELGLDLVGRDLPDLVEPLEEDIDLGASCRV